MIVYTYKLDKYIRQNILPKLLLNPNRYLVKGSFRRKIPYITDIDIVNDVYPEINENNIYQKIVDQINKIKNDSDVILVYVTCGFDERFKIKTGSEAELDRMQNLLNFEERENFILVRKKYTNDFDKKIFYISEIIWDHYKLRWPPQNILDNEMTLAGGLRVTFTDQVAKNSSVLFQYYVRIGHYYIGIDIVTNYKPVNLSAAYQAAADYQLKLANYGQEYYYMLFPFKHYFKLDKKISSELEDLIEKKFGLFKQLMVRIDTYHTLYNTKNLDIRTATEIVTTIIKDIKYLPGFKSNVIESIRKVALDNPPDVKMNLWNTLLYVLYDEINMTVNMAAKKYFFKYLNILPPEIRSKYHLNESIQ